MVGAAAAHLSASVECGPVAGSDLPFDYQRKICQNLTRSSRISTGGAISSTFIFSDTAALNSATASARRRCSQAAKGCHKPAVGAPTLPTGCKVKYALKRCSPKEDLQAYPTLRFRGWPPERDPDQIASPASHFELTPIASTARAMCARHIAAPSLNSRSR